MTTLTATPKQISYALSLAHRVGLAPDEYALVNMTRSEVSRFIDRMRASQPVSPAASLEAGMYLNGSDIFKVQRAVHGSGNLYAKRFDPETSSFEYAPGAIRSLTPAMRMSLDQAKRYGALYGTCIVCGRTLTDENSIAQGIGPVCAGRL